MQGKRHSPGWKKQSAQRPKIIGTRDFSGYLIPKKIGGTAPPVGRIEVSEKPADMRVKQSFKR